MCWLYQTKQSLTESFLFKTTSAIGFRVHLVPITIWNVYQRGAFQKMCDTFFDIFGPFMGHYILRIQY